MTSIRAMRTIQKIGVVLATLPSALVAQNRQRTPDVSVVDTTRPVGRDLRGLRWRLVGPFRGGRAVAVTGDPTKRNVFYFGAVDGGVWKTTNGGTSWRNISDGVSKIASVGAITVAPSDPNVVYVGSGEADLREDWTYGDGMYRSTDA